MECGEISGIYARWVGGDIPDVSQDTLQLKIGHVILALLAYGVTFGIGLIILGVEFLWLKLKGRNVSVFPKSSAQTIVTTLKIHVQ